MPKKERKRNRERERERERKKKMESIDCLTTNRSSHMGYVSKHEILFFFSVFIHS